ncbi:MAG: sulfatase, partial [Anaerolineales bacterium]|nr:sulfatase [Anaerolineales bacterium]
MPSIGRRDFLKLGTAVAGGVGLSSARPLIKLLAGDAQKPNIILVLMDAMSASNLSLYGYPRPTSPNLQKFAEQAIVYHAHHAASNFTTAGTASMLTGLYPWTHRAINFRGLVKRSIEHRNMFSMIGSKYHCLAFSQNPWVNLLLGQMAQDLDEYLALGEFAYQQNLPLLAELFPADYPTAYMAFEDFLGANNFNQDPGSITLGFFSLLSARRNQIKTAPKYPNGLPSNFYTYFRIEDLMIGIAKSLERLEKTNPPFFAYYHLLPPHAPYQPRRDFLGLYRQDGLVPTRKPEHPLAEARQTDERLIRIRLTYDQYVTNLDHEFGIFVEGLEASGILEKSYLIVTSDHGEIFERGEQGHGTPLMYEPVTRIPLLVRAPGQRSRVNVDALTSNVDLLPTLLSLAGQPIPDGLEGRILPSLGGADDSERGIFSVFAKESSAFLPLAKAVVTMNKSDLKMIYYRGYNGFDGKCEFYNLKDDPEEMNDLGAHLPAEDGRRVGHAHVRDEVLAVPREARVRPNVDGHIEITGRA